MQLHGGNIYTKTGERAKYLDFSANLNPFGMPQPVLDAALEGVRRSDHYPDADCTALRRAIASALSVDADHVCCGNGAAELLDRLAVALGGRKAMVLAPTFGEYERALSVCGWKVLHYYLKKERHFTVTEDILRTIRKGLDLLVLCCPNNPTGQVISAELLQKVLERCREIGCRLLVDESFLDLTDAEMCWNLVEKLADNPHLILLRSMTKSYCMPGLRLGYLLCSDVELLNTLKKCAQPWSVSLPAQMSGVAALGCGEWLEDCRRALREERQRLEASLTELGFEVVHGCANFILFHAEGRGDLCHALKKHGILLRSCESFRGLGPEWYRTAVRTREENQQLIAALSAVLNEQN